MSKLTRRNKKPPFRAAAALGAALGKLASNPEVQKMVIQGAGNAMNKKSENSGSGGGGENTSSNNDPYSNQTALTVTTDQKPIPTTYKSPLRKTEPVSTVKGVTAGGSQLHNVVQYTPTSSMDTGNGKEEINLGGPGDGEKKKEKKESTNTTFAEKAVEESKDSSADTSTGLDERGVGTGANDPYEIGNKSFQGQLEKYNPGGHFIDKADGSVEYVPGEGAEGNFASSGGQGWVDTNRYRDTARNRRKGRVGQKKNPNIESRLRKRGTIFLNDERMYVNPEKPSVTEDPKTKVTTSPVNPPKDDKDKTVPANSQTTTTTVKDDEKPIGTNTYIKAYNLDDKDPDVAGLSFDESRKREEQIGDDAYYGVDGQLDRDIAVDDLLNPEADDDIKNLEIKTKMKPNSNDQLNQGGKKKQNDDENKPSADATVVNKQGGYYHDLGAKTDNQMVKADKKGVVAVPQTIKKDGDLKIVHYGGKADGDYVSPADVDAAKAKGYTVRKETWSDGTVHHRIFK